MTKRFGRLTLVAVLMTAFVAAIVVVRPSIVERWGIYASATDGPPASYPLFLEPFPTKFSCEVEARIIVRNGGHAICRSHRKLELGTREQDLLWAQFWPSARWIAFCQAQFRPREFKQRARTTSLAEARN
jgi:hypothetical protein